MTDLISIGKAMNSYSGYQIILYDKNELTIKNEVTIYIFYADSYHSKEENSLIVYIFFTLMV